MIVTWHASMRSEEHTSELQSPIDISYAVFCLKKKNRLAPCAGAAASHRPPPSRSLRGNSRACVGGAPRSHLVAAAAFFFFNDTATTEIYTSIDTLSLHDALPI